MEKNDVEIESPQDIGEAEKKDTPEAEKKDIRDEKMDIGDGKIEDFVMAEGWGALPAWGSPGKENVPIPQDTLLDSLEVDQQQVFLVDNVGLPVQEERLPWVKGMEVVIDKNAEGKKGSGKDDKTGKNAKVKNAEGETGSSKDAPAEKAKVKKVKNADRETGSSKDAKTAKKAKGKTEEGKTKGAIMVDESPRATREPPGKAKAKAKSVPKAKAKSLPKAKAKSEPKAKSSPKAKAKSLPKAKAKAQAVAGYQPGMMSALRREFLSSLSKTAPEASREEREQLWKARRTEHLDAVGMSEGERKKRRFFP